MSFEPAGPVTPCSLTQEVLQLFLSNTEETVAQKDWLKIKELVRGRGST